MKGESPYSETQLLRHPCVLATFRRVPRRAADESRSLPLYTILLLVSEISKRAVSCQDPATVCWIVLHFYIQSNTIRFFLSARSGSERRKESFRYEITRVHGKAGRYGSDLQYNGPDTNIQHHTLYCRLHAGCYFCRGVAWIAPRPW